VTVGQTLTKARSQAGLSVDELSERTRIRGTVIRSIEQDDFEACGGDLYVRGYVRALAGAVGIDAQPLIREFDLERVGERDEPATGAPARPATQTAFDLPAVQAAAVTRDAPASAADLDATRYDMPTVRAEAPATSYDLPRVAAGLPGAPEDLMDAGYDLTTAAEPGEAGAATTIIPAPGSEPADPPATAVWTAPRLGGGGAGPAEVAQARTARKKRRGFLAVTAAVVVLAAAVLGIRLATEGSTPIKNTAATSVPSPSASAAAAARASAAAQASASAAARASAAAQASASAAAQASKAAAAAKAVADRVVSLPVVSATAFGPDGLADGDDPGSAGNVIARNASGPWSTQWYNTPTFGLLKHGTGLLLELGGKDAVTSVRLGLSAYQGADLQLRVGNGTALSDLKLAATANNAGGTVNVTLRHPVAARYLLIWFTQLAQNGSGEYQETVSHVAVSGRR
jgi:hypothetical protein